MAFKMKYKNVGELLKASGFKANMAIVSGGLGALAEGVKMLAKKEGIDDDDDNGDDNKGGGVKTGK